MRILKRSIVTFLSIFTIAFILNQYFFMKLHKEAKNFTEDKYKVSQLTDLYSMACTDEKYKQTKDCVNLSKEIQEIYLRADSDYKFINFYIKYMN